MLYIVTTIYENKTAGDVKLSSYLWTTWYLFLSHWTQTSLLKLLQDYTIEIESWMTRYTQYKS